MKLRGLIFDFDNTIINSDKAYQYALQKCDIDPYGEAFTRARHAVHQRLGPPNTQRHHRVLYFKQMFPNHGPIELLNLIRRYEAYLFENIAEQWESLQRRNLFEFLKKRFKIAVLTNENTRTQIVKWGACDPRGTLFNIFITSEEIGFAKPDHHMIDAALEGMRMTEHECAVIGDSLVDDCLPAEKRGMQAWQTCEFLQSDSERHANIECRLSSLEDLRIIMA